MKIYDLSPRVSSDLAVFPGDTPPSREVLMDTAKGDPLTLSTFRSTVHVGTHVDAPLHYGKRADGAKSIDEADLDLFVGVARVVEVDAPRGTRFTLDQVKGPGGVAGLGDDPPKRVLFRTNSHPDPNHWRGDFNAFEPGTIDALADLGVELVGIDTPSVDVGDSKELPSHARCLARDVWILEGIVLTGVSLGDYELIALPLNLEGFDASPVRAVLVDRS